MMTAPSDIKHWKINATIYEDRVEETHFMTDPARNIRRRPYTKVWRVEHHLGRGSFGDVRLEKDSVDGNVRAVKRIAGGGINLNDDRYQQELKALLEFSKPKSKEAAVFVEFYGWFQFGPDIFFAMEYIPLGDLEENVNRYSGKIPEVEARDITEQILSGLEIMHAESFAHRDLKPQNVLVVHGPPEWWIKLADFGLSKRLTGSTAYRTFGGTQYYMAPEILDTASEEYTNAVDLWAVGCITYRLVTGIVPFLKVKDALKYCEDKSLFPNGALHENGVKSLCARFIKELLEADPQRRISASQALNHEWILTVSNMQNQSVQLLHADPESSRSFDSSVSSLNYNTNTHDGLKSHIQPLLGQTEDPELHSEAYSVSDNHLPAASNYARPEQNPAPRIEDHQSSTRDKATSPAQESDGVSSPPSNKYLTSLQPSLNNRNSSPQSEFKRLIAQVRRDVIPKPILRPKGESKLLRKFEGHTDLVCSVAFSHDRTRIVSASNDKTVRIWDVKTGAVLLKFDRHTTSVRCATFSPDSRTIASGCDDTILLWDPASGTILNRLQGPTDGVDSIAFSPDGTKITASGSYYSKKSASKDNEISIRLWDVATGSILKSFPGYRRTGNAVAFSPDGTKIVSGCSDYVVRDWDTTTGNVLHEFKGHETTVTSVAYSPDGAKIASASLDNTVRIWDAATGAMLLKFTEHTCWVVSVAYSPDSTMVASAAVNVFGVVDNTVRLWDASTGTVIRRLDHPSGVHSIAYSPDGRMIVSALADSTIWLWDIIN
ncbi:WD40-repeat-containing domain protein [Xylogone sp. PMI_703]|nr:WD40-repeat-containing domain protein [Xylogone sp. PMI_703]